MQIYPTLIHTYYAHGIVNSLPTVALHTKCKGTRQKHKFFIHIIVSKYLTTVPVRLLLNNYDFSSLDSWQVTSFINDSSL